MSITKRMTCVFSRQTEQRKSAEAYPSISDLDDVILETKISITMCDLLHHVPASLIGIETRSSVDGVDDKMCLFSWLYDRLETRDWRQVTGCCQSSPVTYHTRRCWEPTCQQAPFNMLRYMRSLYKCVSRLLLLISTYENLEQTQFDKKWSNTCDGYQACQEFK